MRRLAALVPLLAAACTQATLERAPAAPMERAIFLREAAQDGWHGISHANVESGDIARVVDPALVDAEARIEILPNLDRLRAMAGPAAADARLRLEAFVDRPGKDPVPLHLPDYDLLDGRELRATPRPLAEVVPSVIDLERTIAALGDRVVLRSTLLAADGTALVQPGEAHFRVRQLGWHSDYHPSVVLARSFEREITDANFNFTPGVAWLHTYSPRQDEVGFLTDWMRATAMAIGPHALLLQFDSEEEVEIGLGVTIGFWDGVFQLGTGLNLMADEAEDRPYFYVGSSLISVAQALQRGFNSAF